MKVLVLGAAGMLGHKLLQGLAARFEVAGTVRKDSSYYADVPVLKDMMLLGGVDAQDFTSVATAIVAYRPDAVLNCIGVIKQVKGAETPVVSISINSLFPHKLAEVCVAQGIRLIHFSTDCVFSGKQGSYTEEDNPDPVDLYGRTKLVGEISGQGCLTLRTSIVGRELNRHSSLFDWFIKQKGGAVKGFAKAFYSGLTTQAMARLVGDILVQNPDLEGVWHMSAEPINKFELLCLLNRVFCLGVKIEKDEEFFCDRRLDSSLLIQEIGFVPPNWERMIEDMAVDPTPYSLPTKSK